MSASEIYTNEQYQKMYHAVAGKAFDSYRNYYVSSTIDLDWEGLVNRKLAKRFKSTVSDDIIYCLTDFGRQELDRMIRAASFVSER